MKHSLTTPEISPPKSDASSPRVLINKLADLKITSTTKQTDASATDWDEEKPKKPIEIKKKNFDIRSYLSSQKNLQPPTQIPQNSEPPVQDKLCREFLNSSVVDTKSSNLHIKVMSKSVAEELKAPNLHKKVMSKINSQVELPAMTKPSMRALDLCVSVVRRTTSEYECCDPRAVLLDVNNNDVGSRRSWTVREDIKRLVKKKAVKWQENSMNLVDSHCHFEMLFSK